MDTKTLRLIMCSQKCPHSWGTPHCKSSFRVRRSFALHSVASVGMTLAIVWESTRIAVKYDSPEMLTPFQCMVKSPYPTLYIISDTTVSEAMLFLSLDLLISLRFPLLGKKIMHRILIAMMWFYFLTIIADVAYCWYRSVVQNQNSSTLISVQCINSEVLPEDFYLVHYMTNAVVTLIAAFLCLLCMFIYHRQKSENDAVRAVQLKRQGLVLKRLTTLFLYTLIVQTMPLLVVTCLYANGEDSPHLVVVWLAQIILYPTYPLHSLTREYKNLKRQRSVKSNKHQVPQLGIDCKSDKLFIGGKMQLSFPASCRYVICCTSTRSLYKTKLDPPSAY
ncbi:hypothetical protein M514_01450 [Trichuris suis]|uniref:G-protein coupled receptors family 1 profile domain-containing protein n=1 Tax=Trichuris suis TaxID=68888 RepID=A0A085N7P8_9BILA|nr:hypothetical protein M514_01450 [Trichuris suis]